MRTDLRALLHPALRGCEAVQYEDDSINLSQGKNIIVPKMLIKMFPKVVKLIIMNA